MCSYYLFFFLCFYKTTAVHYYMPFFYYKLAEKYMWFDIKTRSGVIVGLANHLGIRNPWIENYLIVISTGEIEIHKQNEIVKTASGLPFTLSEESYTRFWVICNDTILMVGMGHSSEVILSCEMNHHIKFIVFKTRDREHTCSVKFEVSSMNYKIPRALSKPKFTKGKLHWKRYDNQLPDECVIGGHVNGEVVYIIRANHMNSLTPGLFVPSRGLAFVPWGGSNNSITDFEALCGFDLEWKPASKDMIPVDAFVAGFAENTREALYIGRAQINGHVIPGKVQISHKVCYIPQDGNEVAVQEFEVLTEPGLNEHCAHAHIINHF